MKSNDTGCSDTTGVVLIFGNKEHNILDVIAGAAVRACNLGVPSRCILRSWTGALNKAAYGMASPSFAMYRTVYLG